MNAKLITLVAALLAPALANATPVEKKLCVFDVSGKNGDIFNLMKDYQAKALEWGVKFEMKPYTDEKIAAGDFKAGQCDAVLITGTRARRFHKLAGTVEAMGALPTYAHLKKMLASMHNKRMAKLMKKGKYEVGGLFPAGAVYLFVNDRSIDTVGELSGKKIATLDYDAAAKRMVAHVSASMAGADITTFSGMFNNKSVSACYAPATAYKALELYKGIGSKGGVIEYPLAQLTLQLLIRTDAFPEGYGQKSRDFANSKYKAALALVKKAEKDIPKAAWVKIPPKDKEAYDEMFRSVRIELRDKEPVFHKTGLKLMRKIRCKIDGARAECAEKTE